MSKKIVIVSYATYPGISPRNLRTHELAKEFVRKGHEVKLYVLTGDYDYSSYEQETGIKVVSLGKTFFFNYNPETGVKLNIFSRIIKKFFGKFFEYPFIELIRNVYFSLMVEKEIDLLITIAVPYPIHWGAALFKTINKDRLKDVTWVADCGDPYMGNDFSKYPFYFSYIEKWCFRKADFISIPIEAAKSGYYQEFHKKIKIIPQGIDFDQIKITKNYGKNSIPTFIYAGIFYENKRDPRPLLDYLIELNIEFKFIIYTRNHNFLKNYEERLIGKLEVHPYIPRVEVIFEMSKADFLINFDNPSDKHSPSKLIDYALSKRPILSINSSETLNKDIVNEFLNGNYSSKFIIDDINKYNISRVADQFLDIL